MRNLYAALLALPLTGCSHALCALFPPSPAEIRANEDRDAEQRAADARRADLEAHARAIPILDSTPNPYRILGFVSTDSEVGDSSSAVLDLQVQALSMGGNAVLDVAHEIATTGTTTTTRGRGTVSPFFGNAVMNSRHRSTTTVTNVEHWTAKVIVFEVTGQSPPR